MDKEKIVDSIILNLAYGKGKPYVGGGLSVNDFDKENKMDKMDFKGALEDFKDNNHPENPWDDELYSCDCHGDTIKAIQTALRIADRLQAGNLQDVATEQHKLWEKYLGGVGEYYSNNGTAWLGCLNKAMVQQLLKDCEDGKE